jgi:hypothetical protein
MMHISFPKRKVNFLYLTLAIISMLLALVSYARAETTDTGIPQEEVQNQGRMEDKKAVRGERGAMLTTGLQDRFINLVRNVFNRMDAAVVRLEDVAARLEARAEKLSALGVDTSKARTPLHNAQNKLREAKNALTVAKSEAELGLGSDSPRENFKAARDTFITIRESIRDAYILLREALSELKDAVMESELNQGKSSAVSNVDPSIETPLNN